MKITAFDLKLSSCPLCSSTAIKSFAGWNFKGIPLQYDQCHHCGFIFQNPTYTEPSWTQFYKADYRKLYNDDSKPADEVLKVQRQRAAHYSSWLASLKGKVTSHLDIGSSAGIFLKQIKDDFGITRSTGIEPGDDYREFAEKNGFSIYQDIDSLIAAQPERFELITLCHVLEHIPDFVGFVTKIRKHLLASNGYLFIEVPNIRGSHSFEVAHPNCFSYKTLKDALEMGGFRIQEYKEHGMPRTSHPESRIYLSTLSTPTNQVLEKATPADPEYIRSSLNHIRKGFTHDTWFTFWLKHPIKKLLGKYPV